MISCLVTSLADLKIWILKVVGRGSFGKKLTGRTGSGHMTYAPHKLVSSRIEHEPVFVSRPITSAVGKASLSRSNLDPYVQRTMETPSVCGSVGS